MNELLSILSTCYVPPYSFFYVYDHVYTLVYYHVLRLFFSFSILSLFFFFFFFNDTATTEIYTLSLHDALPISLLVIQLSRRSSRPSSAAQEWCSTFSSGSFFMSSRRCAKPVRRHTMSPASTRSEEHTSELQSHSDLVCRLLLEKKKKQKPTHGARAGRCSVRQSWPGYSGRRCRRGPGV